MKKGMKLARTHAALSGCLLLAALLLAGGGVYAVLGGSNDGGGGGISNAPLGTTEAFSAATAIAEGAQQWFRDTAAEDGIPLPESAREQALATAPRPTSAAPLPETVVSADTPTVIPVHLPTAAMTPQRLEQALPGLHMSPQAQAQVQYQLDALASVTVGITTSAVNQGAEEPVAGAAKSRMAQKGTGGGTQGLGLDLAGDYDAVMALLFPDEDCDFYDINGVSINENGAAELFDGNGIPDRAELMSVEHVLNTPDRELYGVGGVNHTVALARWQIIMDSFCLEADPSVPLSQAQRDSFMRVVAGYCMLGDPVSVIWAALLAALSGWSVDQEALRGLFAPMPWPFSAEGNFTGTVGKTNYAKWLIAHLTARDACQAEIPPCTEPSFDEIFAAYADMLDGITDQEALLAQRQDANSPPLFNAVTVQVAGQFLAPTVGRWDWPAWKGLTIAAVPDTALHFDHWQVTPKVGMPLSTTDPLLNLGILTGDVTVRAVARHEAATPIDFAFTDPCLEQAVRAASHKGAGSPLLWGDVEGLVLLEARGAGITSLDGLQYLTGLVLLDLRDNQISDLTPLGNLTELKWLLLGLNSITQSADSGATHPLSPLSGMARLELLDLGWGFASLDPNAWASLGQANHLRNLAPLSSLTHLVNLDLCGNDLVSLDGLYGKTSLGWLFLSDNAGLWNTNADTSHCGENQATLASLGGLGGLMVQNAGVTDDCLAAMLTTTSNTRRLSNLSMIGLCGNHEITTLDPLGQYAGLRAVVCGDNPGLTNIDALQGMTALETVRLVKTGITRLSALTGGNLHDGLLTVRENAALHDVTAEGETQGYSVCGDIDTIESHGNTVDRDFACNSEVVLTLRVSPSNTGSTVPGAGSYPVYRGASCLLQAVQTDPNYLFSHWTGFVSDISNPTTRVCVDRNKTVTAVFADDGNCTLYMRAPVTYDLDNNSVRIVGTEHQAPGITSPAQNDWKCRLGETRHLHAEPAPGWAFVSWWQSNGSYQEISQAPDFDLVMDGNKVVCPVFLPADRMLHLDGMLIGNTVTPSLGYHYYATGQEVHLHAEPYMYHCFLGWQRAGESGYISTNPDTTLIMNQDYTITPRFQPCFQAPLDLEVYGFGQTTPEAGTYYYNPGQEETLHAAPWGNWRFIAWFEDGHDPVESPSLHVSFDANSTARSVTAVFDGLFSPDDFQTWLDGQYPGAVPSIGTYPSVAIATRESVNGHTMPDLVRLTTLYLALSDTTHPLHTETTAKYWNNLKRWYFWINDLCQVDSQFPVPNFSEMRTYAAYSTLSEALKDWAVAQFISKHPRPEGSDPYSLTWANQLEWVEGFGLEADPDGDGFSNIDEWLFVNWLTGNTLAAVDRWDQESESPSFGAILCLYEGADYQGSNTSLPNFYNTTGPNIPLHVQVTIAKEGDGTLMPGAGTYLVPTKKLSAYWNPDNYWLQGGTRNAPDFAYPLTVSATSTAQSSFQAWRIETEPGVTIAQLGSGACLDDSNPDPLPIPQINGIKVIAQFDNTL